MFTTLKCDAKISSVLAVIVAQNYMYIVFEISGAALWSHDLGGVVARKAMWRMAL